MKRTAFMVAGLGFGDEGKGATVHYLAQKHGAGLVVRYNGGPQAAHNVVTDDGRHHTFAQFGSAMFIPGVHTYLSEFMAINPAAMMVEAEHLAAVGVPDAFSRTLINEECLIVTPFHRAMNRLREMARGDQRHGSCGMGVGEAVFYSRIHTTLTNPGEMRDPLIARDLINVSKTGDKLRWLQKCYREQVETVMDLGEALSGPNATAIESEMAMLRSERIVQAVLDLYENWVAKALLIPSKFFPALLPSTDTLIFEGAQGLLIDELWGSAPHNSWTDATYNNAYNILRQITRKTYDSITPRLIGVMRAYMTRHGAGPFPTEDSRLSFPEPHNKKERYQGDFRFGYWDHRLVRYACYALGPSEIVVNHLDHVEGHGPTIMIRQSTDSDPQSYPRLWDRCSQYREVSTKTDEYLEHLQIYLPAPITIISHGSKPKDRTEWIRP